VVTQIYVEHEQVIECSIKPATCGRGKLTTNFTIIRELHGITKSAKMRFEFVEFLFLKLTIPLQSKKRTPNLNRVHTNVHMTNEMRQSLILNQSTTQNQVWGVDTPLWESTVSASMMKGGQPLVRQKI
jgi:hypothetical protein